MGRDRIGVGRDKVGGRVVENMRGKVLDGWFVCILKIFRRMVGFGEERSEGGEERWFIDVS